MKLSTTLRSIAAGVLLPASMAMASVSVDELRSQAKVMEGALKGSSITSKLTNAQRQETGQWLHSAIDNLQQGNLKTAQAQLLEAGRLLYPMTQVDTIKLSEPKQISWLAELDEVLAALQPAVRDIAEQKGLIPIRLDDVAYLQQSARDALARNDLIRAEQDFIEAYSTLQQEVVRLRSGDLLVIKLPDPASQEGWLDAERRFADWRYFADWMVTMAEVMGTDAELIGHGSAKADQLLVKAEQLAKGADWQGATSILDEAYKVMEDYWRKAGVDI